MAWVKSNGLAVNQLAINFNLAVTSNVTKWLYNNNYLHLADGSVAEDLYSFQPVVGGTYLDLLGYSMTSSGDELTGGTVQAFQFTESINTSSVSFYGIDVDAMLIYNAAFTSSTSDDIAIINSLLSGNDRFDLSSYGDFASGRDGNDLMYGNGGDDSLFGANGQDTLDGGSGRDQLFGGAGNDTYFVDGDDVVAESVGQGSDVVQASASFTLSANIEKLVLIGSASISGTGNNLNNVILGNSGNNYIDGKSGTDTLAGGQGDDVYVNKDGDVIQEGTAQGIDLVMSAETFSLPANIENLVLTGSAAIDGTGNGGNNVLVGNTAANSLNGRSGNDGVVGGIGKDLLTGGAGSDLFIFQGVLDSATSSAGADVVADFVKGQDKIDLHSIDAFGGTSLNDSFFWKGTAAFSSATQGEVRYQKFDLSGSANDYTMVWIDNDGDTAVEMAIRLTGLHNLAASDFIF